MSMMKKRDQEIFVLKVVRVTQELNSIVMKARHGFLGWSDFIEKYAEGIKKLKEIFENEGMGGL